jgi:hypothetical protein
MPKIDAAPTGETKIESFTNWKAFKEAGLRPTNITCNGYKPVHLVNEGCHTNLILEAQTLKNHLDGQHGGGFYLQLEQHSKVWPGWEQFAALGVELHDFRCDVCDAELKISPQSIVKHLRNHMNKNRRMEKGGRFVMTIGYGKPESTDEDTL